MRYAEIWVALKMGGAYTLERNLNIGYGIVLGGLGVASIIYNISRWIV